MLDNPEHRTELVRGILASGLVLVGLATGSASLFSLLVATSANIGGNLLSNIADRAIGNWRRSWFTPDGVSNDHIREALRRAFTDAVRQMEIDWKKSSSYHYLKFKKEHERAQFSLLLLRELREDVDKLFQDQKYLVVATNQILATAFVQGKKVEESDVRSSLSKLLADYLGAVETLADFANTYFADKWLLRFASIIRSDQGTTAWRACETLWHSSLLAAIGQTQQLTSEVKGDIEELHKDVVRVTAWLEQWDQGLATSESGNIDSTVAKAFETIFDERLKGYQNQLLDLKRDTESIIDLLKQNFIQLDFEQVMLNFLQKELLGDQYINLKQSGHNTDYDDVSIGKVFVDLAVSNEYLAEPPKESVSEGTLGPGIISEILQASSEHFDPETVNSLERRQPGETEVLQSRSRGGRFVLIGGPGQGKTTIAQFICQLFRTAILLQRSDALFEKVRNSVNEIVVLCKVDKIELPHIARIPFRIVLSDFAARLSAEPGINSLLSYILDRIRARTDQEITADLLRRWLSDYPWLIVLDGLDEVPASSNRDEVLAAVDGFWIDANGCNADVLVVATTRPQGYNDEFAPVLYQHKWLVPLSKARALHYSNRLVSVRYRQDQDRQNKIIDRLKNALDDVSTARLMRSPLQVTIMTALVDRIGKPPQERWSLFQKYYSIIYQRETEREIPAASILRNYEPDINAIHYRVGLLLQIEGEYSGRTGVSFSRDRFEALVEARLVEEGHEGKELVQLKQAIMEAATDRLVFLVGMTAKEIGFEIRSLQEFMAAEALMGSSDELVHWRLREIAPIANWRNVFLFAAGKCFALQDRQHLREAVRGICAELNESEKADDEIYRATLSGSKLALDLLEDGPAQRQPKYAKSLARLACRLWELPPSRSHRRLAEVFDPKLEDVYRQELEAQLQSSARSRLAAWDSLMPLMQKYDWAAEIANIFWPHASDELLALLRISLDEERWNWALKHLESAFSLLSPSEYSRLESPVLRKVNITGDVKIPAWMRAALRYDSGANKSISLNAFDKTIKQFFSISVLADNNSKSVIPLKDFPNPGAEWLQAMAVARFVDDPSKDTLAREIRNIAQHFPPEQNFWWPYAFPWMLRSLVETAGTKDELLVLAERVEMGDFGDAAIWAEAENRWLSEGVSLNDIEYMTDEHWPFDRNVNRIGFPLSDVVSGHFSFDPIGESLKPIFQGLLAFRAKCNESHLCSSISACLSNIMFGAIYSNADSELSTSAGLEPGDILGRAGFLELFSVREYMEIVLGNNDSGLFYIPCLQYVGEKEWNDPGFLDLVAQVGAERNCWISHLASQIAPDRTLLQNLVNSLVRGFVAQPNRVGILFILAELSDFGLPIDIPVYLLNPDQYNDPQQRAAAVTIRLGQQNWTQSEAKALARNIVDIAGTNIQIFNRLLRPIRRGKEGGQSLEVLLLELLQCLPVGDWEATKECIELLDQVLTYRTTNLINRWTELGLPASLRSLIHVDET